ncbi:MAG TPA: hypothetical protein VGQ83_09535 [Polyangia bacterium]
MPFRMQLVALALGAALVATPAAVRAQGAGPTGARTAAIIKQVEDLTRQALGQYELLEFDAAKKLLADADNLVQKNYLTNHPVAARVAVAQGVILISAFKDRFNGRRAFLRALTVDPAITLAAVAAAMSTPELVDIFAGAQKEIAATRKAPKPAPGPKAGPAPAPPKPATQPAPGPKGAPPAPGPAGAQPGPGPTPPPAAGPPAAGPGEEGEEGEGEPEEREIDPREVRGIVHTAVPEALRGTQVRVKCVVGPDVNASKVFVFYRPAGREDWTPEMMGQQKGAWVAVIPSSVVKPPYIHYYIEVRDGRGKPQIASGNVISPHQIVVTLPRAKAPAVVAARTLVEDELEVAMRTRQKRRGGGAAGAGLPLWAALGVGTGFGGVAGTSDTFGKGTSGIGSAPLHVAPEVGMRLGQSFGVSIQGRLQVLSAADHGNKFGGAGLARGYWFFGGDKLTPYAFLALGGGYILHTGNVKSDAGVTVSDTFKTGPLLVGPGAGVTYKLAPKLALVGELGVLVGAPTNTTFNADINLGVAFSF